MRSELDDRDMEILGLLTADARRPYSEIAEAVDLSPPAVSDRVHRLRELGVIRRFTLDLDRSSLREGVSVLVDLDVRPADRDGIRRALTEAEGVGHVFTTADARIVFHATSPSADVYGWLSDIVDLSQVEGYDVDLLSAVDWTPDVGGTDFALSCVECGNTVTSEGVTTRIDDERYQFCCESCEAQFTERYEGFRDAADT